MRGFGTQQLERLLAERYPEARLARMDLDTTSTKWSHQRILASVEAGDVDLLLGTQMIAKGLDFPERDAGRRGGRRHRPLPAGLPLRPSARSSCWRRWRGARGGAPRAAACWCRRGIRPTTPWSGPRSTTPRALLRQERALRESPPYPPATALVNLIVSGTSEREVGGRAPRNWRTGAEPCSSNTRCRSRCSGPAPCPLARIKDRWRWHVLLKGPSEALGRIVRYAAQRLPRTGDVRIVIDRDPVALL